MTATPLAPATHGAVRRMVLVPAGSPRADRQLRRFRLARMTLDGRSGAGRRAAASRTA